MIRWNEKLGPEVCPYLQRWVLDLKIFSVRLHHWLKSDDTRAFHDHAWNFFSFVLKGSLTDKTDTGSKIRKAGTWDFFSAKHKHSVIIDKPVWTIIITGPTINPRWGFWVNGRFRKRNKYFFEHGHHDPCSSD